MTHHSRLRHRVARLAIIPLLLAAPGVAAAQSMAVATTMPTAALDSARSALAKYADPYAAIRDGYFSTLACIEYPQGAMLGDERIAPGGMGVHFLNVGLVGQPLNLAHPQVLIYEPDHDTLRLVAAEWFVPAQGVQSPPMIFGHALAGPMHGHAPIMPPEFHHYDLHVWLWKDNSVVLVQKNPGYVQVSFSRGPLLELNHEEGGEPVKAAPRESRWRTIFRW